jgi:MGT family glycosyltransferase
VDYWSFPDFRAAIERTGARYRAYPEVPAYRERQAADNLIRLARLVMEVTERVLPELLRALAADPPDVIVHDALAVWGAYVSRLLRLPAVTSISTFVIDDRVLRRDPWLVLYGLRQILAAWPEVIAFQRIRARLQRRYGEAPPRVSEMWSLRQRLNVVFTSRELQPWGSLFDDRYAFVGSALRREDASGFPLASLGPGQLVYVSLGTLFNDRPDFFRAALAAFGRGPGPVVLSIGASVDVAALGPLPPNAIVRRFVPQLALLRRASLFVTHGGMNSVNEGLSYGVPLVVYPQVHDQLVVARRVAELGAGVVLRGRVDATVLRRAADEVVGDPRFRERARALGATLRAAGGAPRAADEIERLVRQTRASSAVV